MKRENKYFIISLLLATLLHAALFSFVAQRLLSPIRLQEPKKTLPIAYMVSLPRPTEIKPKKADALAMENRIATQPSISQDRTSVTAPRHIGTALILDSTRISVPLIIPRAEVTKPVVSSLLKATIASNKKPLAIPAPKLIARPIISRQSQQNRPTKNRRRPSDHTTNSAKKQDSDYTSSSYQDPPLNFMPSMNNLTRWDRLRRNQISSSVQSEETVSLNTRKVRYVAYFSQLKKRLEQGWSYPSQAKKNKQSGNANLQFTIRRDGHLLYVKILRTSGTPVLDDSAVRAVHNAAPFAPFPGDWSLEKLHVRATFEYIRRGGLVWRN